MDLQTIFVTVFLIFFSVFVFSLLARKRNSIVNYYPRKLFSPAERSFYGVLSQAISDQYLIFGKVRIWDVIGVKKGLTASARQSAMNKIANKHFDFLLCDKDTLSAVAAIELDDKSHMEEKAIRRDSHIENVCRSAALPLIRFNAQSGYQIQYVRDKITNSLNFLTANNLSDTRIGTHQPKENIIDMLQRKKNA